MRDNQESKKGTRRTWVEFDMDVWKKVSKLAQGLDRSPSWFIQTATREKLGMPPRKD